MCSRTPAFAIATAMANRTARTTTLARPTVPRDHFVIALIIRVIAHLVALKWAPLSVLRARLVSACRVASAMLVSFEYNHLLLLHLH